MVELEEKYHFATGPHHIERGVIMARAKLSDAERADAYAQKKKNNVQWQKDNKKRIAFEVEKKEEGAVKATLKEASDKLGISRNTFIKIAISEKLESMGMEWPNIE